MYNNNNLSKLSWSKINLFLQCERCFFKEQKFNIKRPGLSPDFFYLNNVVDELWKNEFDQYRNLKKPHPIMVNNKIDAIPFMHKYLDQWRNYKAGGIKYTDEVNKLELSGVIDELWINEQNELILVDFKATAKSSKIIFSEKNKWSNVNERQISFYAFLFSNLGYKVSAISYFIYSSANIKSTFNQRLEFESSVIPYNIDCSWIGKTIYDIRICLDSNSIPQAATDCQYCKFQF
jgi:hypothetical protein